MPVSEANTLVGLAGSVTTVTAIALGLPAYDPDEVHHARISAERVHEVTELLLSQTRDERAANPVIHPGRVDVIGAGALIADRVDDTSSGSPRLWPASTTSWTGSPGRCGRPGRS